MEDIKAVKKQLRAEMKRKRQSLSIDRILLHSTHILQKIISLEEYKQADVILAYVSFSSEADTHFLINHALSDGKKVAVPKIYDNREMRFYIINSIDELSPGAFGILEPNTEFELKIKENENYLLLLPGVAFDEEKNRLGYGGGYYDTFLAKHPHICKLMPAYELQKHNKLPVDEHDVKADIIITELNCYK